MNLQRIWLNRQHRGQKLRAELADALKSQTLRLFHYCFLGNSCLRQGGGRRGQPFPCATSVMKFLLSIPGSITQGQLIPEQAAKAVKTTVMKNAGPWRTVGCRTTVTHSLLFHSKKSQTCAVPEVRRWAVHLFRLTSAICSTDGVVSLAAWLSELSLERKYWVNCHLWEVCELEVLGTDP